MKLKDAMKYCNLLEETIDSKNIDDFCLITKMPINNKITLPCNHVFEYDALLNNLLYSQTNYTYPICPYCRKKHDGFIPYNNNTSVKIIHKNYKIFNTNNYIKCSYCFKSGKSKNTNCEKVGHFFDNNHFCFQHGKKYEDSKNILLCKHILKNGNNCKFKCFNKEDGLCKRHYNMNIKNKLYNCIL